MAGLQPPAAGKVNGLSRPSPVARGHRVRFPARHPSSLIAFGFGLYGLALMFPLLLRQVTPPVFVAALAGTAILLWGLHVRWTRSSEPAL
ncbi:MAG TPA: hypothetical protein VGR51_08165 [Thermoplasmata archaeon]|jgi:hypothetical protein|nr:hypothetical protein [Thermoplasmata archaeon]